MPDMMPEPKAAQRYFTAVELADYVRLNRSTLYAAMKRGDLPSGVKIGRRRVWDRQQVDAHLARRAEQQGQPAVQAG